MITTIALLVASALILIQMATLQWMRHTHSKQMHRLLGHAMILNMRLNASLRVASPLMMILAAAEDADADQGNAAEHINQQQAKAMHADYYFARTGQPMTRETV